MRLAEVLIEAYCAGCFDSVWKVLVEAKHKADNGRCYEKGHVGPVPCGGAKPAKMTDKPRRPKGRTSPPQPSPTAEPHGGHDEQHERLVNAVNERAMQGMRSSALSTGTRNEVKAVIEGAVRSLTPNALRRVHDNATEFHFYEDHETFLRHYREAYPNETDRPFGYYHDGHVHVDGGDTGERLVAYVHECMHAMNGPNNNLLSDKETWIMAHHKEIRLHRTLTPTAQQDREEGLVTFATYVYTGMLSQTKAKRQFPRCYGFLKTRGLL